MSAIIEEQIHFPITEAAKPLYLGINLGGVYLKVGVIDDLGRTVSFFAAPHHAEQGPEAAMQHAAEIIRLALEKAGIAVGDIAAAGYSFQGSMDPKTEHLHRPPNFPD